MSDSELFKILALLSPFVSAIIASYMTFSYANKLKKSDILYQNRIPAFKQIVQSLTDVKRYCLSKMSVITGSEYSPYWETNDSALTLRTKLAEAVDGNSIFLSAVSKAQLEKVDDYIGILCNAEVWALGEDYNDDNLGLYSNVLTTTEKSINSLYKELNIE